MQDQATVVLECIVGSQLHGTATPHSDTDIRIVQVSSLATMLSPFGTIAIAANKEQKHDEEVHELQRLMKLLSQCNVTAIEMLWSDMIRYEHRLIPPIRAQRHIFLDAKRLYDAARGYSKSQRMHVDQTMTMGARNTDSKRAAKFAAAYVRVMSQVTVLIRDGDYSPRDVGPFRDSIVQWKEEGMTLDSYRAFNRIQLELDRALEQAFEANTHRFRQDFPAIERITRDIYVEIEHERESLLLRNSPI